MDHEIQAEITRLHERANRMGERITHLEAQVPHTTAALKRIEASVERINGHIVKGIWLFIALFAAVLVKFTVDGGWTMDRARAEQSPPAIHGGFKP